MSKYGAPAPQGGQVYLPFVFETYGLWGKHFHDVEESGGVPRYPRSGHQHVLAPEDLCYSAQDYGGGDFSQSWTSELWTLP